jgi:hypothetical protein
MACQTYVRGQRLFSNALNLFSLIRMKENFWVVWWMLHACLKLLNNIWIITVLVRTASAVGAVEKMWCCKVHYPDHSFSFNYDIIIKKLKQSHNRPGVAQRVPGGLGSQIFMTFGTWSWWGRQPHALTPLPPGMFLVLIFTRGWVDPRACDWKEMCHWEIQWHHRESIAGPSD